MGKNQAYKASRNPGLVPHRLLPTRSRMAWVEDLEDENGEKKIDSPIDESEDEDPIHCRADDLMLLCRADVTCIGYLKAGLAHFAEASNLEMNASKSVMFFGGIAMKERKRLAGIIGMEVGVLPVKYLGVPLSSKKLNVHHYVPLIEKMTARITS